MPAGPSNKIPCHVFPSEDGFGPVTKPHLGSARRWPLRAPTNAVLRDLVRGYGPESASVIRPAFAELLDWREGRLRYGGGTDEDAEYRASIEYLIRRGTEVE